VYSSSGVTVTIEGQWNWTSQPNCPTTRNGVGYQVAWFDGNTANPIGSGASPDGVLYVGDPIDNIVHSIETLGGSSAFGNAFWDGVPSSYLTHNTTNSMPTTTDAANWFSNCGNVDPTTKISSGTWGPISHTYPTGTTSITVCPVLYDPHGAYANSGKSTDEDITAGGSSDPASADEGSGSGDQSTGGGDEGSSGSGDEGSSGDQSSSSGDDTDASDPTGHNTDNSYEGNGQADACLKSTIQLPPPSSQSTPPGTTTTSTPTGSAASTTPTTTPSWSVGAATTTKKPKKAKKHHKKNKHVKAKKISRPPRLSSGFTG
jgi:hypothetical protein